MTYSAIPRSLVLLGFPVALVQSAGAQEAAATSVQIGFPVAGVVHVRLTSPDATGAPPLSSILKQYAGEKLQTLKSAGTTTSPDGGVSVSLSADGRLSFSDASGKTLLSETGRRFSPKTFAGKNFTDVDMSWESAGDDSIYGLGQYQDGLLDIRGATRRCHQKNLEDCVPLWVSSAGWGILWDNPAPFEFTAAKGRATSLSAPCAGGVTDYYVLTGPTPGEVIAKYRRLTGSQPMPPKWAFGYHQSKERYHSPGEVLGIAAKFRETGFPLDLIIQDWQYWGDHGWNACVFDEKRYPDASGMIAKLHADNLRFIVSVWPSFTNGPKGSAVYRELTAAGLISPHRHNFMDMQYYDVFSPKARDIVWNHAREGLFDKGVDGWWLDASEPELGGSGPGGGHQTAEDLNRFRATVDGGREFLSVANAYPFFATQAFHDGQRASGSDKRVFILTRSAYTGIQRNGAFIWTGDTRCTWDGLRNQIPACLGMSFSGIPYVNTDIGGFACAYPGGCDNPEFRELVVRWFQFGALCPEFRMHGTGTPREPWRFGKPGDTTYDTLLAFTKFRYRLLPYLYSVAWGVTDRGDSMLRALPMDFPDDPGCRAVPDQFVCGPSLLAAPVVTPVVSDTGEIIPTSALLGGDRTSGGLDATYFKGIDFGTKKLARRDSEIRFNWSKKPRLGMGADPALDPVPELGDMDGFSVRWEGFLRPDETGEHELAVSGDDGFRLWADGKLVCENWKARPRATGSGKVRLTAGKPVAIRLEYFQDKNDALLELRWRKPSAKTAGIAAPRSLWLPAGTAWTNLWTGETQTGGRRLELAVPLAQMPMFLRAGSILPLGPEITRSGDKPDAPIELRIVPGADGRFDLYEDFGDGFGYEKGERAVTPLSWDDKSRTLTIGARRGEFPGMVKRREFRVVLVQPGHGVGFSPEAAPDVIVPYEGGETKIVLKP